MIALDPYQDLYRKDSTWKSIGIEARGVRQLKRVYRNSREIERFARRFLGEGITIMGPGFSGKLDGVVYDIRAIPFNKLLLEIPPIIFLRLIFLLRF